MKNRWRRKMPNSFHSDFGGSCSCADASNTNNKQITHIGRRLVPHVRTRRRLRLENRMRVTFWWRQKFNWIWKTTPMDLAGALRSEKLNVNMVSPVVNWEWNTYDICSARQLSGIENDDSFSLGQWMNVNYFVRLSLRYCASDIPYPMEKQSICIPRLLTPIRRLQRK